MDHAEREFEASDSMDASDVILPSQYFGAMGGGALCSEQRLMLAVLVDAINILQDRRRQAFVETVGWITTKGTRHLFSFDSVCDALNIHPETLRGRLGPSLRHGSIAWEGSRHLRIHGSNRMRNMTANHVREKHSIRRVIGCGIGSAGDQSARRASF
jgi:hypothetical protein